MTTLQLPGKTRWGSMGTTFESVLKAEPALQSFAIDPVCSNVLTNEDIANIVDNDNLWTQIKIISPMKKWITILESDEPRFHLVVEAFEEIRKTFNDELTDPPVSNDEIYQLLSQLQNQYDEFVTDAHLAVN